MSVDDYLGFMPELTHSEKVCSHSLLYNSDTRHPEGKLLLSKTPLPAMKFRFYSYEVVICCHYIVEDNLVLSTELTM